MPQLSDTMQNGRILSWHKKPGDFAKRGDILAEVETDKANLEIECFDEGVILKVIVPEGSTAGVGEPIAIIGAAGEELADTVSETIPQPQEPTSPEPSAPL